MPSTSSSIWRSPTTTGAPPSLEGFLAWLREGQREIKRDMEQGRNEVRVMTVHGAKGLEAPIVFLPDTCTTRSARPANGLLILEDAARPSKVPPPFLWPVKGTSKVAARAASAKARISPTRETEERNRLLYVALTRARDRLYVAGFEGKRPPPQDCWYNLIKAWAGRLPEGSEGARRPSRVAPHERADGQAGASASRGQALHWSAKGHCRRGRRPRRRASRCSPCRSCLRVSPRSRCEAEEAPASPSRRPPAEPPILAPARLTEDARFLRGTLTHALLEHLPAPAAGQLASGCGGLSRQPRHSAPGRDASGDRGRDSGRSRRTRRWHRSLGPDSRAEVAIAAEVPHPVRPGTVLRLTGKIDRLVRDGQSVMIVDYKTNRPPPASPDGRCRGLPVAACRLPPWRSASFPRSSRCGPRSCGPTARASWRFAAQVLDEL